MIQNINTLIAFFIKALIVLGTIFGTSNVMAQTSDKVDIRPYEFEGERFDGLITDTNGDCQGDTPNICDRKFLIKTDPMGCSQEYFTVEITKQSSPTCVDPNVKKTEPKKEEPSNTAQPDLNWGFTLNIGHFAVQNDLLDFQLIEGTFFRDFGLWGNLKLHFETGGGFALFEKTLPTFTTASGLKFSEKNWEVGLQGRLRAGFYGKGRFFNSIGPELVAGGFISDHFYLGGAIEYGFTEHVYDENGDGLRTADENQNSGGIGFRFGVAYRF